MKSSFLFRLAALAATAFLATGSALAGPLKLDRVASDAQWVAHLDIAGLVNSELFQFVLHHGKEMDIEIDGIAEVRKQIGIDPLHDLIDITAYGVGDPHDANNNFVAIITATPAIDDLVEALKAQPDAYGEEQIEGYAVKSFKHDGEHSIFFRVMPGAPESDRVIVAAHNAKHLVNGLKVMEGKQTSMTKADKVALKKKPRAGSYLYIAASDLGWITKAHGHDAKHHDDPASAVIRDAKSITFDAGESEGVMYLQASLGAADDEAAANLRDICQGLLAMGRLAANSEPELEPLKRLIKSARVELKAQTLTLEFSHKTADVIEIMQSLPHDQHDEDEDEGDENEEGKTVANEEPEVKIDVKVRIGDSKPD